MESRVGGRSSFRAALIISTILATGMTLPVMAQDMSATPAPPTQMMVDDNGVDLRSGQITLSTTDLSIGDDDSGLVYARSWNGSGWLDNITARLDRTGTMATVVFSSDSDQFTDNTTTGYSPIVANGSNLTYDPGTKRHTYTSSKGLKIRFAPILSYWDNQLVNDVVEVIKPDGEVISLTHRAGTVGTCTPGTACTRYVRLQSATSTTGYQLKLEYQSNDASNLGNATARSAWMNVVKVTALNNAVEYCNPSADSCSFTQSWPNATYASSTSGTDKLFTVTDAAGRTTRYTIDSTGYLKAIKRPTSASDNVTITYTGVSANKRLQSVTRDGKTWQYNRWLGADGEVEITITDPLSKVTTAFNYGTMTITNPLGQSTVYSPRGENTYHWIEAPEDNKVSYTYDSRGNVTYTTLAAKPGSGLASIVTSATYPATCTNPLVCNKPLTTTDARGKVTDYTYDPVHGGVLTVTQPAPTAGGVRPQTRYSYAQHYAWYKNSAGTLVQAPTPIWRLTGTSTCATLASCTGSSDERVTTFSYGASGTGNNLHVTAVSTAAGNGSVAATTQYARDAVGNVIATDGPLAGTADTSRLTYNAARQLTGSIGPDPDGGGTRLPLAERRIYDGDGALSSIEYGNVASGATDVAAIAVQQKLTIGYNGAKQVSSEALTAGGTIRALTQYSYDNAMRPECTALRMNPSIFASPPASACSLGAQGSGSNDFGADRITRKSYDDAGRVTKVQTAYGTAQQADETTIGYTNNGQVSHVIDAESNRTTYIYDGHDRLSQTRYPVTTKGANSSNASDYEQFGYDAAGNVTSRRLRDGTTIAYSYDDLGRMTFMDRSNAGIDEDITYTYDLLGRMRTSQTPWGHLTYLTYDALGRRTGETTTYGPLKTSQYDAAGRRTRLTWHDGFYVDYDYDMAGNITAIRENGATSGVGVLATYGYDDLGRRTSITRGNGTTTSYGYDAVSRLASLTQDLGGSTHDITLGFSYNPASQIAGTTRSNDTYAWAGHYNVDRTYAANGLNQLTTAGSIALGYDARGNLTSSGSNSYTYGQLNQLVNFPGGSLYYDPLMRLDLIYASSAHTALDYDGANLSTEYNYDTGAMLRRYVHGPGVDEPIVWYEGAGTTDRRWLHADERGSVVAISNSAGATTNINSYDEYGIPAPGNIGRFGYTGQAWLPELGMWYYKARIYSPTLGRFMQTDPIGYADGMNWYNYVKSDPVNSSDPSGLDIVVTAPQYSSGPATSFGVGSGTGYSGNSAIPEDPNTILVLGNKWQKGPAGRPYYPPAAAAPPPQNIGCQDLQNAMRQGTLKRRVNEIQEQTSETGLEHGLYGGFDAQGRMWISPIYQGTPSSLPVGAWIDGRRTLQESGAIPSFLIHSHPTFPNSGLSPGDKSQVIGKGLTVAALDPEDNFFCQAPK